MKWHEKQFKRRQETKGKRNKEQMRQTENDCEEDGFKSNHINHYTKFRWCKHPD